ncbi:MAG: cupin domain-containing protein [Gammaproteobacteria bacterium]|nr:cupin domain-containing protein [Gammaproteobacteria bacterium]
MQRFSFPLVTILLVSCQLFADSNLPKAVSVEKLPWISPPPVPGLTFTWVLGNEADAALYALRVKLAKGAIIPPHSHPDDRSSTVLSGTLYVGFGNKFDKARLIAVHQGDVYHAPAGVAHFLVAMDGDVEYQEIGIGPTKTRIIK